MLQNEAKKIIESFEQTKQSYIEQLAQLREDNERFTEEYKVANTHGDRRENAAFEDAVAGLKRCSVEFEEVSARLNAANAVSGIEDYTPMGMVVLYSTVKLKRIDDNRQFVYMIFPEGVSDLDRGILSIDSRIAQAIKGKKMGDVVQVTHNVNGNKYSYVIEDVY